MAVYNEIPVWEEDVILYDRNTPVLGGSPVWTGTLAQDGFSNVPIAILANRTRFLKERIDNLSQDLEEGNYLTASDNLASLENRAQARVNLGLGDVDNTPDAGKPVSVPQREALDEKVDKEEGKGLSSNDFTDQEKQKLSQLQSSRYQGLYTSLQDLIEGVPNPEPGYYADVDEGQGHNVVRYIWDEDDSEWVEQLGEASLLTAPEVKSLYESNPDTNAFDDSYKSKLDNIESEATKNASDASLRDRTTHTGEQPISSITGLDTALGDKVNKQSGKGLSTEDYTTEEKTKLESIEEGATATAAPVNADWDSSSGLSEIKNKPTIPTLPATATQEEAETGTETALRLFSPNLVRQAILSLAPSGAPGTVTSVGLSMPTGFSVANTPVTTSGTITVSLSSGYSLPTTVKQGEWDTAFGWGDHSQAGYATESWVENKGYASGAWTSISTNATLTADTNYLVSFAANRTLTLPASPSQGATIRIVSSAGDSTGSTINRNGETIMGLAEDMTIDFKINELTMVYSGSDWRIAS